MKTSFAFLALLLLPIFTPAQKISIQNNRVKRELTYDGKVWRTTLFAAANGAYPLPVTSDEVHLLFMDDEALTISDFIAAKQPVLASLNDTRTVTIFYKQQADRTYPADAPQTFTIQYSAKNNEPYIRKIITLNFNHEATIDRLETERFISPATQTGGGRGEPVFVNNTWFFGIEYPAFYSRRTDGNTPVAYSRHYEKVGNYSYINLDERDIAKDGKQGMVRLFHFPGYAKATSSSNYQIVSKTSVAGLRNNNENMELAFEFYMSAICKKPRSFLHYNNWFDPGAKDLSGDALLNVYKAFKTPIQPYGIKLDAMVPDDGWQNRQSIWQPSRKYFPNGLQSLKALSNKLSKEGVGLGLWLSLGGTGCDTKWGDSLGYVPAKPNQYFSQFFSYYSLSNPRYKNEMLKQVPLLAKEASLVYFKHDFNQLSDTAAGNGHPPTDRHGHEASVDAMIEILLATQKAKPGIYQNLTNWMWYSPWWLMYGDALWMLAGDDGQNGNYPEISGRAMATTDRDTYIWRMWGDSADRPLVPVSRLMTHGIIRNTEGSQESKEDNLQDWMDHVMMHYGRGTLLKEWYISPSVMNADYWRALCTVHNWVKKNEKAFNNTVYVGRRPDEGSAYGYIGWNNTNGVLVVRNPNPATQTLIIPFNKSLWYTGFNGQSFKMKTVYPYQSNHSKTFISGKNISITIAGYATMAFEITPGKGDDVTEDIAPVVTATKQENGNAVNTLQLPADATSRCDLLVIGYPVLPQIKINGKDITAARNSKSAVNNFAGYAIAGMPSNKAKPWAMASYDLRAYAGQEIEITYIDSSNSNSTSYLLAERTVQTQAAKNSASKPWTITNNTRRQTIKLK